MATGCLWLDGGAWRGWGGDMMRFANATLTLSIWKRANGSADGGPLVACRRADEGRWVRRGVRRGVCKYGVSDGVLSI